MCTYTSLVPKQLKLYSFLSSPCTIVTDAINDLLDTFPNTMHIMLNIEPQIETIVLHLYKKIQ